MFCLLKLNWIQFYFKVKLFGGHDFSLTFLAFRFSIYLQFRAQDRQMPFRRITMNQNIDVYAIHPKMALPANEKLSMCFCFEFAGIYTPNKACKCMGSWNNTTCGAIWFTKHVCFERNVKSCIYITALKQHRQHEALKLSAQYLFSFLFIYIFSNERE